MAKALPSPVGKEKQQCLALGSKPINFHLFSQLSFKTMAYGNLTAKHLEDSVNTCDCCGRTGLKATVLMLDNETGAEFYFGRVCAARNSGKTSQQLTKELRHERRMACGRCGNRLLDLRRTGTALTKGVVLEACKAESVAADDLAMMLRTWVRA